MNRTSSLLALCLSLVSLPGFCQDFVSDEKFSINPMDGVGVAHNAYAGCIANLYDSGIKQPAIEVIVYRCGFPTDSPEQFIQTQTALYNDTKPDVSLTLAENLRRYRDAFSEEQFSYFEDIDQIFATSESAEQADERLKHLEEEAVNSLGREDGDLAVLGGISTARHSLELWTQDRQGDGSKAGPGIWGIILADVGGLITGYLSCGKLKCAVTNAVTASINAIFD